MGKGGSRRGAATVSTALSEGEAHGRMGAAGGTAGTAHADVPIDDPLATCMRSLQAATARNCGLWRRLGAHYPDWLWQVSATPDVA